MRISAQRTRVDWAAWAWELVDVHDPKVEQIVLAMDILTIHSPASLYVAFPAETKRIAARLEIHHTSTHSTWLNMAEIELSALR